MLKLLLGVVLEVIVAVMFAGLVLALGIPLLNSTQTAADRTTTQLMIVSVLACAVGIALFRPDSAIHRYTKRTKSAK
jgi:type II secretory pathway component PulJ